jgi:dTDP-4-dehydrorhamnose 3,5-epimerase
MRVLPTELPGVLIVEPDVFRDERGFFLETYRAERYAEHGITAPFVQDNHSRSRRGTLRGLHAQLEPAQGKLVRAVAGEIIDVAVDIRVGSPTFARHVAVALSGDNFRQLWIPPFFAHGFLVVSDVAEVEYKCTEPYRPQGELAIAWNDPEVAVRWSVEEPTLSTRDAAAPPLAALRERLPRFRGGRP